jgi:penicillin-binding protein 1A
VAFKDAPKIPFVAPSGIRMVRIDRVTGKRVFGTFPTAEDPKSSVIWEAFQPETEPRRSFRRSVELAKAQTDKPPENRNAVAERRPAQRRTPNAPADSGEFLQRQGGIY